MGTTFTATFDRNDPDNFFSLPQDEAVERVMAALADASFFRCDVCGREYSIDEFADASLGLGRCPCGGSVSSVY
jgi:hypothetical protein